MGLYNEASLIMYPSGYKSGKIYCQKPVPVYDDEIVVNGDFNTDTDWSIVGDFVISGGVASITNASTYSQLTWLLGGTYLTSGKKYKLICSISTYSINNTFAYRITGGAITPISFSEINNGIYETEFTATSNGYFWFQTTGTYAGLNVVIDNVSVREILTDDADLTFTRASTATRVNESGLIEAVASGVPRIDFLGAGCGKLLLEPQRTNLITNSEDLSGCINVGLTLSTSPTSPISFEDATTLTDTATSGTHSLRYANVFTADGSDYTLSLYVKGGTKRYIALTQTATAFASSNYVIVFDTQEGVYTTFGGSDIVSEITPQNMGNGWWRIGFTTNKADGAFDNLKFGISNGENYSDATYLGDGNGTIYVAALQVEKGSYPTSYIPTAGSTVTRVADASSTSGLISVIGQTEGTIILDTTLIDTDNIPFGVSDGTSSNYIQIETTISSVQYKVKVGGVEVVSISTSGGFLNAGDRLKVGLAYKANDFAMYINGTLIGTDAAGGVPATSILRFARYNGLLAAPQKVQSLEIYDTRLTNAELEYLTGTSYNSYELMAADLGYTVL